MLIIHGTVHPLSLLCPVVKGHSSLLLLKFELKKRKNGKKKLNENHAGDGKDS